MTSAHFYQVFTFFLIAKTNLFCLDEFWGLVTLPEQTQSNIIKNKFTSISMEKNLYTNFVRMPSTPIAEREKKTNSEVSVVFIYVKSNFAKF